MFCFHPTRTSSPYFRMFQSCPASMK
jgi:hypothetical protein